MNNYTATYKNVNTGELTTRKIQAYTAREALGKGLEIRAKFMRGWDLIEIDKEGK